MQYKIEKALELCTIVWHADLPNIKEVIEQYCYFIDDAAKASQITVLACKIDNDFHSGMPAKSLYNELISLKETATGLSLANVKASGLLPDYSGLKKGKWKFRGAITIIGSDSFGEYYE